MIEKLEYLSSLWFTNILKILVCVLPTLRNGAFFAGAAARLKSSLRHMSSSRNTNSAGPSCTSSLTCKQQRPTLYSKSKGCVLKYTACEILLSFVDLAMELGVQHRSGEQATLQNVQSLHVQFPKVRPVWGQTHPCFHLLLWVVLPQQTQFHSQMCLPTNKWVN